MGETTKLAVKGILAADEKADLIILQVEAKEMPVAELAGPALSAVGEKVYAIGNPEGMTNTLSEGLVSGVRKDEGNENRKMVIQTSAAISPGSSGGPLLRPNGTVVGVTFARMVEGQNLNFAIPVEYAANLIKKAKNKPVLMAVTDLPASVKAPVREAYRPGRHPGRHSEPRLAPPSVLDVANALADLAGDNKMRQMTAASWLEKAGITNKADVAKVHDALAALLGVEGTMLRAAVVKAFGRYADAKDSAVLAKVARGDKEYWTCYAPAMRALMEVDAKVARSIFEDRCDDFSFEPWATTGLMELSSSSEQAIWPLLESKKAKACTQACRILGKIGSAKSIPILKDVTGKNISLQDRFFFMSAADAAVKELISKSKNTGGN
jgi:hypothetical protein